MVGTLELRAKVNPSFLKCFEDIFPQGQDKLDTLQVGTDCFLFHAQLAFGLLTSLISGLWLMEGLVIGPNAENKYRDIYIDLPCAEVGEAERT